LIALALALTAGVLAFRFWHALGAFLSNLARLGPGYSREEQTLGLIALGLIGACLVAVVRIVCRRPRDD